MSDITHSTSHVEPNRQVLEEAAVWYANLSDTPVDDKTKQAWQDWYDVDQSHRIAWQRVEEISQMFGQVSETPSAKALYNVNRSRRKSLKLLSIAAISMTGLVAVSRTEVVQNIMQDFSATYSTAIGEVQRIVLANQGDLWLNTNSAIQLDRHADTHTISLLRGEIYISQAGSATGELPLQVQTPQGRVSSHGDFSVRNVNAKTYVAVFDGSAQLFPEQARLSPLILKTGLETYFTQDDIGDVQDVQGRPESWVKGILVADNMLLSSFVDELSRYFKGHLYCDERVANLRIVGTFSLNNIASIFSTLEDTLPVKVRQTTRWWVSIGPVQNT